MRRAFGWLALLLATGSLPAHPFQAATFRVTSIAPAPGAILNAAPTQVLVTLSNAIAPGSVGSSSVILERDGVDNLFGTSDDVVIVPAGITIVGGNQIRIDLTGIPLPNDAYRVRLLGNLPISVNCVGWWKFDESSGTVASDSSGNGHHGTLAGNPQWQPAGGRIGGALNFDGNGDWVFVPKAAALEPSGSMSVSLWANITSVTSGFADIVRKAGANQGGYLVRWHHFDDHLWWRVDRYSQPQIFVEDTQVNGAYLNGWHHIAGTWDAASGVATLYVDGVARSSLTGFTGTLEHTDDLYFMGAYHPGQVAIPGRLDDVRIYSRALTVPEIQSLAAAASEEGVADLSGSPVDGEFAGTFPSGNGAAGGEFVSVFLLDTTLPTAPGFLTAGGCGLIGLELVFLALLRRRRR
jgi:hypothetical protein